MSKSTLKSFSRWWVVAVVLLGVGIAAVPVAGILRHMSDTAVGRTTVVPGADGTERTVYWREYPGIAGIDPDQILDGPTPQQGYEVGQSMVEEIKTALSDEFQLEWAPIVDTGFGPFHRPMENRFGGESLLTNVNGPEYLSTTVPPTWEGKQHVLSVIGEITSRYGYEPPTIDSLEGWSAEDRARDLGGLTPDKQVIVTGVSHGRANQWLSFRFQDLSKDPSGTFEERLRPPGGSEWPKNTLALRYGADGLLATEDREAFESRLEPFRGLTPPEPLVS